ncbi:hypothetical protein B0H14DRAFT_2566738 [Mycena olivaceomarginata]|nr:hypothetical protein B0H14DRAFT_2566738 [Mycena olivaceomarginata]
MAIYRTTTAFWLCKLYKQREGASGLRLSWAGYTYMAIYRTTTAFWLYKLYKQREGASGLRLDTHTWLYARSKRAIASDLRLSRGRCPLPGAGGRCIIAGLVPFPMPSFFSCLEIDSTDRVPRPSLGRLDDIWQSQFIPTIPPAKFCYKNPTEFNVLCRLAGWIGDRPQLPPTTFHLDSRPEPRCISTICWLAPPAPAGQEVVVEGAEKRSGNE